MTDTYDRKALLSEMARLGASVLDEVEASEGELEEVLASLDLHATLAGELARNIREGHGARQAPIELGLKPLDASAILALAASRAAEVVDKYELEDSVVTSLADLFEQEADFCWSVTEWLRVLNGDFSTISTRRPQAEPPPDSADELYRPWKPTTLLDEVLDSRPGEITAFKRVQARECHDERTFVDEPMSGALMLEALGHAAVLAIKGRPDFEGDAPFPVMVSGKFTRALHAGDELILHCEITETRLGFTFVSGTAKVDGVVAVEAKFMFRLQEVRQPAR